MKLNLLLVYLSVIFWHIGGSFVLPFVSIWLSEEIGTPSLLILGLVLIVPNVIAIVGISLLSRFTDTKGYFRHVILIVNIVGMIEYLLLAQIHDVTQYFTIVGIGALIFPAYYSLIQAYATLICGEREKGKVTTNLMLYASIGWFIGSSLGGLGYKHYGMPIMFRLAAIFFLISGLAVIFSEKAHGEIMSNASDVTILGILRRKSTLLILLPLAIVDITGGSFYIVGSLFLYDVVGIDTDYLGFINALATIIGTLCLIKISKVIDFKGRKPVLMIGLILTPVFFLAISLNHNPVFVMMMYLVPLYVFIRPVIPAMMSDITSVDERSRGMSLVTITTTISNLIGVILGGYIADRYEIGMNFWTWFPAILGWLATLSAYFLLDETMIQE